LHGLLIGNKKTRVKMQKSLRKNPKAFLHLHILKHHQPHQPSGKN
jgi:hypothetical protein